MCAANRPEALEVINGLRERGAKHLAIISGDHDRPTRNLANKLGMDRYFAEVLPQDKAKYVELLQKEGRTVCFIGDGINDSIALKKANVSISLRGASTIATDTAQVVFMEESLTKLSALARYLPGSPAKRRPKLGFDYRPQYHLRRWSVSGRLRRHAFDGLQSNWRRFRPDQRSSPSAQSRRSPDGEGQGALPDGVRAFGFGVP